MVLVQRYFDGGFEDIDIDWVREVCSGIYTGRQKARINTPLATLARLQRDI